jgi:secreted trypsin-like serine protease
MVLKWRLVPPLVSLLCLPSSCAGSSVKQLASQERAGVKERIHNGTAAAIGEFSYFALLHYEGEPSGLCGGVLVGPRHVLTLAWCLTNLQGVYIGATTSKTDGTFFAVLALTSHPDYDGRANTVVIWGYEITLASDVSNDIPRATIRRDTGSVEGVTLSAMGYGLFDDTDPTIKDATKMSSYLRKTTVYTVAQTICAEELTGQYHGGDFTYD